ncbi:MAG: TetR/AcrR family transcriptional regulator C-terminal domain-containing protein [Eubacteriales bacterium]|nr:TetR/AcrR family transcriptional regulator C-terminal domain-containing protein [Eubacteriales bacterium]
MAQKTEKAIADALKKLLAKRPLSKITISDIANECGINRMTFYYHYRDVYDLIKTIADEDLKGALEGKRTLADWQEGVLKLMSVVKEDKAFYTNLYHSVERDRTIDYVYDLISELLKEGVDQLPSTVRAPEADIQFIVDFYAYAFVGILLQWVRRGMQEEPAVLVERMGKLGKGGLGRGVEAFSDGR